MSAPAVQPALLPVRRLHALTSLRFVAAGMIVLHHSHDVGLLPPLSPTLFQAVSFFFVLSGFILTYVYPRLETWEARGRFLLARFARVWPAHLASFALLLLLLHRLNQLELKNWGEGALVGVVNLSMLQSWFISPKYFFSFNGVSWSISTEFAFYLFFPFLIHRWNRTWWWKMALALGCALGLSALAVHLQLPDYLPSRPRQEPIISGLVYVNPLARVFEFTLGMFTAMVWKKLEPRLCLDRVMGTLLEMLAVGLVVLNMALSERLSLPVLHIHWLGLPGYEWLHGGGVVCISFALLVFVMALERGWISHALSAPLGVLLGEISFSVYLTHQVLQRTYAWKFSALKSLPLWIVFPLYAALVLMTSHLIWSAIERPFRTAIINLWPRRRGTPDRPSSSRPAGHAPGPRIPELQASLETPGARMRSFFAEWLNPGLRVVLVDLLVIGCLWALVVTLQHRPVWRASTGQTVASLATVLDETLPASRGVVFGNDLLLHGAALQRQADGGVEMTLVWESLHQVRLNDHVAVHLLTRADVGKVAPPQRQADYVQDAQKSWVHEHQLWTEKTRLPPNMVRGMDLIGLGISDDQGGLVDISKGPRDWDNRRLLLPLPPAAGRATQPATAPR